MIKKFKRFLERKGLSLSPDKSKIMVFENGRRRTKKRKWKWKKESIEEVKEIKYLGYICCKERRSGEAYKRKNAKTNDSDKKNMEYKESLKEIIREKRR